jgi:queuine tRNA-ribosyltransferase
MTTKGSRNDEDSEIIKKNKNDNKIMKNFNLKIISPIRRGEINLRGIKTTTPAFMPVGTQGSVKSLSPEEIKAIDYDIILCNTYHLHIRPGEKLIKKAGGLHKFINWNRLILTDSGGFQVFSLGLSKGDGKSLVKIKDDRVEFRSYLNGEKLIFTPEKVIDIQLDLGSDIIMPLDICPPGKADRVMAKQAADLSIDWLVKAKKHFQSRTKSIKSGNRPLLFGIVQGGIYDDLRLDCLRKMAELDLDGYAVGGLAVGEEKVDFLRIVKLMGKNTPVEKPRYLMGVGEPDDLRFSINAGFDLFDCVQPTRLARHGAFYRFANRTDLKYSKEDIKRSRFIDDFSRLDENCQCYTCQSGFSRSYLRHLIVSGEILGQRLLTIHNLFFIKKYLDRVIEEGVGADLKIMQESEKSVCNESD